ncbi:DUF3440 domain-containing protein [Helicobacter sp. 11S02596-1]|uniref:DUF3440 domain-containing protein n=1 Tax=Helicobacter sp. 11S02596-1 TaxID=1476194 RepID=UPI000BA69D4E|nr:DUF3440 domain-containing protein [Helicobacter sp. 11S02596-1]PAF44730.1 hypothetical protein BJI48_01710 [Helicobacter sp. 11S02596-1]
MSVKNVGKKYQHIDVYEAANQRLRFIFSHFERVIVSFSGGKDSGVLLNLVLDYVKTHRIKKKIILLFIDLEAQYNYTIAYIQRIIEANQKYLEVHWCCLPLNLRNATSVFSPFWTCWDADNADKWVRDYPEIHNPKKGIYVWTQHNHPFKFFSYKMEFEEFTTIFLEHFGNDGKKTICLVGIRADESFNRFRTIASKTKRTFKGKPYTTQVGKDSSNIYNAYPIYDWTTEDVWIANYRFKWDYNELYDLFYQAGVPLSMMRICQPYGDDQKNGLNLFRIIEPDTWLGVVNRVSGANFGNIYCKDKVMGYYDVKLPEGHTWKSYTKMLLMTLPKELREHYVHKFIKFIRYWNKKGCHIGEESRKLPGVKRLNLLNSRGKELFVFTKILDYAPRKIESAKEALTWRRMAVCIIKNDVLCRGLSFAQTKEQRHKIALIMEKYKRF